ncbi:hypothetical protein AYO41_03635 [Verrucomicrobia bacterium SCGC AG-212-E04]|nr:hypothetical protein AYO41_03635 [Verrucomicrobia bacterium SCGC AG-212-E04]
MVFFGRVVDKIRLHAAGRLPDGYFLGDESDPTWMDGRCTRFLHVTYKALAERVLAGGTDDEILAWCFTNGRRPGEEEIVIFNGFMTKRGWRDSASAELEQIKSDCGLAGRPGIHTFFDYQDADEGRPTRFKD